MSQRLQRVITFTQPTSLGSTSRTGCPLANAQGDHAGCPRLGATRFIHGWKSGAIGKAPSAAEAVDNPSRLSPAVDTELTAARPMAQR